MKNVVTLTSIKDCDLLEKDIFPILMANFDDYWLQQENSSPLIKKSLSFFDKNDIQLLDYLFCRLDFSLV